MSRKGFETGGLAAKYLCVANFGIRGGDERHILEAVVDERTARNQELPRLVAEAEARRKLARKLAALREKAALSQTVVAARMGTSASVVSKLEAGGDVKLSTLQRYCVAIGKKLQVAV